MANPTLDKVKRECQHYDCGGYLTFWMHGASSDLYYCEECCRVHRWDGKTLVIHEEWVLPFNYKFANVE